MIAVTMKVFCSIREVIANNQKVNKATMLENVKNVGYKFASRSSVFIYVSELRMNMGKHRYVPDMEPGIDSQNNIIHCHDKVSPNQKQLKRCMTLFDKKSRDEGLTKTIRTLAREAYQVDLPSLEDDYSCATL